MSRITFFQNLSDNNVVNKNLIHLTYGNDNIVPLEITHDCSFAKPIFVLGSANFDFKHCNYLYFEDFNRYYYIEDIIINACSNEHSANVIRQIAQHISDVTNSLAENRESDDINPMQIAFGSEY